MSKRPKISIIGSGNIGSSLAFILSLKKVVDIVLLDVNENLATARALDIGQSCSGLGLDSKIKGTNDYSEILGSDIVVVTAGFPRKQGETREDLIDKNSQVITEISHKIKIYAKSSLVIMVTNPLDLMTYLLYKVTNFSKNKIIGMAGVLDSSRFSYFLSETTGVSNSDISSLVVGGHGDDMVPLRDYTKISGMSLNNILTMGMISKNSLDIVENKTRYGGAEIVNLLGNGSAFYAPASSIYKMIDCYLNNKKQIFSASILLKGEYGFNDVCAGVPVILGEKGVEKILELDLKDKEKEDFNRSVSRLKNSINKLNI